ncbi:prepilin peptidase [Streptomyces sp. AJS327]|uniref:prepilin peptidase n=1 Tax=Streptomyces sp. AJS327 TaxID=2545265 RepID=UPI0015DDD066|nr:A24 family peptidase [Streptomyces sp. AJS327]MBA0051325.1 prepilin peptidase [Streptomyces sp. AJS327]
MSLPRVVYRLAVEPGGDARRDCPAGHPLTGPVRGWLGGPNCPRCAGPLGPRRWPYPLVAAPLCALLALATGPSPELAVWLLALPCWLVLAAVDARAYRLPDQLTLPLAGALPVLLGLAATLPGARGNWTGALGGLAALGVGYFVLFLINPDGMAFGDVKLALSLGAALGWYGWAVLALGAFLGLALGAVHGLGLLLLRRASRKTAIPFGPFMTLGTLLGLLVGALAARG